MSPSKKQTYDKNLIKNFKGIQEEDLKSWIGLNTKFIMRPGNNLFEGFLSLPPQNSGAVSITASSRKRIPAVQGQGRFDNNFEEETRTYGKLEEKRFRAMLDMLLKYREYEEEKMKI